jgi:glycerophosphoryl diester phosphodiesterase
MLHSGRLLIRPRTALLSALLVLAGSLSAAAQDIALPREAQIGPRPFYLVDKMKDGPLKQALSQCTGPFHKSDFSIGHRGAALQFPSTPGNPISRPPAWAPA